MTPQEARDRMKAQPFAPLDGSPEFRIAIAIEYAAYYLGEIESHLSKIAAHAEPNLLNVSKISEKLGTISQFVSAIAQRR